MTNDLAVIKEALNGYSAKGTAAVDRIAKAPDQKSLRKQYKDKAIDALRSNVPAPAKWIADAVSLIEKASEAGISFTIHDPCMTKDGRVQIGLLLALVEPYANGAGPKLIKQKTKQLKSILSSNSTWSMTERGDAIQSIPSGIGIKGDKASLAFIKEWGLTSQPESKIIRQLLATFEALADDSAYLVQIMPIRNYFTDTAANSLGPRDKKVLKKAKDREWLSDFIVALKKRKGTGNLTPAQRARLRLPEVKNELLDQMMNTLEAQLRDQVEKRKMLNTDTIKIAGKSFIVGDLVKGLGRANLALAGIDLSKDVIEAMIIGDEVRAADHILTFLAGVVAGSIASFVTGGNFVVGLVVSSAVTGLLESNNGILVVLNLAVETSDGDLMLRLEGRA